MKPISIRLNGDLYTSLSQLKNFPYPEVVQFIEAWYSSSEHLIGYTSGSTGKPKKIQLIKKDMVASAQLTNNYFTITPQTSMLLCLSPSYIAGKMMLVRAIIAGADLIVTNPSSNPLTQINTTIDFAAMVPMQIQAILSDSKTSDIFSRIKQIIIGGAPLSPLQENKLQLFTNKCYGTYGMTETVSHVALRPINGMNRSETYFAIGNINFSIDSRECLVIHTPHLQTQKFITNDIVHLLDSTHFQWIGRHDNIINSGGIKFFPEYIEKKITPFLKTRFFITSEPDNFLGEKIVLVIEDKPWPNLQQKELKEKLGNVLSTYEIPKKLYFLPNLSETSSGKIIRKI